MPTVQNKMPIEKEINLLGIINVVKDLTKYVWKNKLWLISSCILFCAIFTIKALLHIPQYDASLSFILNEQEKGGSAIGGILGQFGLAGNDNYNYFKLNQIAISNQIIDSVLLDKAVINGKPDLIGNHIIRIYGLEKKWQKNKLLKDYFFSTSSDKGTLKESIALKKLRGLLIGNSKVSTPKSLEFSFDKNTSILALSSRTPNEDLSLALVNKHFEKLSNFYEKKVTEPNLKTNAYLKHKADSLYSRIKNLEYRLANFKDRSLGLVMNNDRVDQSRLLYELQVAQLSYGEVLKNKETAQFLLMSSTSYFQVINRPSLPLECIKSSIPMSILKGIFLGLFLVIPILIAIKYIREAIS